MTGYNASSYPNVYPDFDLLVANCARLGIPVPKLVKVFNAVDVGLNTTGTETHGARKDMTFTYDRTKEVFSGYVAGNPLPTFATDPNNAVADTCYFSPLSCPNDMTVFTIATPRGAQATSRHVRLICGGDSLGTLKKWGMGFNNWVTVNDYYPGFRVSIGSTNYSATDTNQWAVGERVVGVGVRAGLEVQYWRGGKLMATTACPITVQDDANVHLNVGGFSDLGTYNGAFDVELIMIWDSAIPGDVITSLSQDPYQLWAPIEAASGTNRPVQIVNKTISQIINFFQTLSTQGFTVRQILATAVTQIPGGGRQIILSGSTLWHCYYEGGGIKVAYSTNNGTTWTTTSVGASWVPVGMAMCIGAGGYPILAAQNGLTTSFYQWNGTTWNLASSITTNLIASESFQIAYDGANYLFAVAYKQAVRYVRVYKSTSLVTWTDLNQGIGSDNFTDQTHRYRSVAACLDVSGNLHLIGCIKLGAPSGAPNKLYYRKLTAYVGGTNELVDTGGSGVNVSDMFSGLSIAVDDLGVIHVAARAKDPTFTSRMRVVYYQRSVAGVWSREAVHTFVDADQDYPSISLNLRTPIICWASSGLGLSINCAKRGGDGIWTNQLISSAVRDSVQTVQGPSYGSSYNYTRGVVGSMRGSEEYFYSSDIISGNAAAMISNINFSSILSTMQRAMSSLITFASSLTAIRGIGLSSTINFTSRLNFARQKALVGSIDFTQHLEGANGVNVQPMFGAINFTSTLAGVKSPVKAMSNTINFASRLNRTVTEDMSNTVDFTGAIGVNVLKRQNITHGIAFVSALGLNFRVKKTMSNVLNFVVGLVSMKADEGCQPAFTPERPLPVSEDDVNVVYLIGPLPDLQLTVQLKRPEYGNDRRQSLQVKVNRTRGGKLRVHARTPTYEPQTITFESLSYLKLEQVRNFLRICKGKQIYYLDEKNRKWQGYITSSDVDLAEEARDRGGTFVLDFEGRLVS